MLAGCLLAVFSFISLLKLFHSHDNASTSCIYTHVHQAEKAVNCSVCDYHFAKDAEHVFSAHAAPGEQAPLVYLISYQSRAASSIGLGYADRGPPAIA
jgi:hypothetical protein